MNCGIKEIQEICAQELSTKMKIAFLDELKERFNNDYGKAKSDLTKNHIYCPFCDDYHQKDSFVMSSQIVEKHIKPSPYIGGDVPQLINANYYEKIKVIQYNYKCPNGHNFTTERLKDEWCIREYDEEDKCNAVSANI